MLPKYINKNSLGATGEYSWHLQIIFLVLVVMYFIPYVSNAQPNIIRVEYYIDTDPGFGNATAVSITASPNIQNQVIAYNPTSLSSGVHRFYARAKDANGSWSLTNTLLFYKPYGNGGVPPPPPAPTNITRVEYYIDTDPGLGNAANVSITPSTNIQNTIIPINPTPLTSGVHRFYVRAKNANGNWSLTNTLLFYKPYGNGISPAAPAIAKMRKLEYYIDTDPGYGNGVPVVLDTLTNFANYIVPVNVTGLAAGNHTFWVRGLDKSGSWSMVNSWAFTVPSLLVTPSLVVNSVTDTIRCARDSFYLSYDATGTYNVGNVFNAELSDATGSFASPTIIGSYTGTVDTIIEVKLPSHATSGTNYQVRVSSTNPVVTGIAYLTKLNIHDRPAAQTITGTTNANAASSYPYSIPSFSGSTWLWLAPSATVSQTTNSANLVWNIARQPDTLKIIETNQYGCVGDTSFKYVNVYNLNISGVTSSSLSPCTNSGITVGGNATGVYNSGNIFTAQLSDASGSFASPTTIGTVTANTLGLSQAVSISATLPQSLPGGSAYRVRIVSSSPAVTGSDNGTNIIIIPSLPSGVSISPSPGTTICIGTSAIFTATPTNGGNAPSYQWYDGATQVGTNSPTYTTSSLNNGDIVTVQMTSNAACATGIPATSNSETMTVTPANVITLTSAAGTSSQTLNALQSIANITYSTTGATGATFSGLPPGVSGSWLSNVVTISGSPTSLGNYSYSVNLTGGCGTVSATGSINVNPSQALTVTVTGIGTYTYSGSAQGPSTASNTGTGSSYTFSYAGVSGTTYGPSATRPVNAGSYTVTATVAANGIYASASSSPTAFTIGKATPTVTVTGIGTYYYNGSGQGPNAASNTGTGMSYSFSYVGISGTTYGPSASQPVNVGSYTVTATVAASTDGNWAGGISSPAGFSIALGTPATMTTKTNTTPQSAAVSTAFTNALAVTIKDVGGNLLSGINVVFTAPATGASGIFSNTTNTITVATNTSGVASAPFTANATAGGPYNVSASSAGMTTVNFSLTNTAGAPATMTTNTGTTPQSATVSTAFANALAVTIKDGGGNPLSGVNVVFTAPASGASGIFSNATNTISVATNASGVATAPFTANATAGGPYNVSAASAGLTTVNFSLTNTAGAPATMTSNTGTTSQSATVSTAFTNALAVTIKDGGGNPLNGVNVVFTAPATGASGIFSNTTNTITVATNANGVASAPFTANATAGGPYIVSAASAGLTTVNFSLTNTAGTPATMTTNTGTTPQSATVSTAFTNALAVTIKDGGGNLLSGINVVFTAPATGASGIFSNATNAITVATNASGVATAPFTANATAGGPYNVSAASAGLTSVNFSLTNVAGPNQARLLTVNSGTTLTLLNGTVFSVDSLVLTPSADFVISNNSLGKSGSVIHLSANPYISLVYQFANNTNPFSGSVQFYYSPGSELSGIQESQLTLNIYDGTQWNPYTATTRDATNHFVLTNSVAANALSELTLANSVSPLIPKWLTLTATKQGQAALLQWPGAKLQNSSDFLVQHSTNGNDWTTLATLPALGNTGEINNYTYIHTNPLSGINNYRIIQTDPGYRDIYSETKTLLFTLKDNPFIIIGNPVSNNILTLQVNTPCILSLYTADGKLLWKSPQSEGIKTIDVSRYAKGIYFITSGNSTQKVLIL